MLLDCTLRDGGYYTNWNFDSQMVKDLIQALDLSKVDVIELGYKSPVKGGKYRKCNDRFIWDVLDYRLPVNVKLAFMIDAKDFIKDGGVDFSLIDDCINPFGDSPFEICRLAIKHSEIELAYSIGSYIKKKGYDLVVNLMGISLLNDEQINQIVNDNVVPPEVVIAVSELTVKEQDEILAGRIPKTIEKSYVDAVEVKAKAQPKQEVKINTANIVEVKPESKSVVVETRNNDNVLVSREEYEIEIFLSSK